MWQILQKLHILLIATTEICAMGRPKRSVMQLWIEYAPSLHRYHGGLYLKKTVPGINCT